MDIDDVKAAFGALADRGKAGDEGRCVIEPIGCGKPLTPFRDGLSAREYSLSGLCQECQDKFFGAPGPETCTCDRPCCEADVGIGIITCGSQHCPKHSAGTQPGDTGSRPYHYGDENFGKEQA